MCRVRDRIRFLRQYDDAVDLQNRRQMMDLYIGRSRRRLKRLRELNAPTTIIQSEEKHLGALEKKQRTRTRTK